MADRVARVTSIAGVLVLGAFGMTLPDSVLAGGTAWLAFLLCVLSGWGWFVVRVARVEDPDFALRTVWGMAAYLAITGVPVMLGNYSRPLALVAVGIGAIGFAWREMTTPTPLWRIANDAAAAARSRPMLAYFAILVAIAALLHVVGAVAHLDRNPWDDDVAYTAFLKRLLDAGDMIEPFSFRRLAAYGGQTALQALVGARGNLASVHALDQGLCFGLVLMLLVAHARALRVNAFWLALVVLAVVLMPDISINTASYWSGAAFFIAIYRTAAREHFMIAGLLGAATCTLRQNYIPVVALFFAFTLLSRLQRAVARVGWRDAWRDERATWSRTLAIAIAVLAPWCTAAFLSNQTFLFPFMKGTWNHGLTLGPSAWSWVDELSLFLTTTIFSQPIVVLLIIAPLMAFADDDRPTRPLTSLFVASVAGLGILVHSFTDADSQTMWRYAFGYSLALFSLFALEVGGESEDKPVQLAPLGRWCVVIALLIQLAASRSVQVKTYKAIVQDLREAAAIEGHGDPNASVEQRRYAAMQAAIPARARVLVMLDDPAFLDFSRNEIANLDTPGFASPGTQMPSFVGAEPVRSYLLDHGYRYIAFVRPERSRYAFRRDFWVWRVFNDTEFFQAMSAYMISTIESFVQLAADSTVLYDADGLVVVDLERPHEPARALDPSRERERRDQFSRELARRENLEREWSLTNRMNVVFADGCSGLGFAQNADNARWVDFFLTDPEPTRGVVIRWLYRRVHIQLRGESDMHLVLRGRVSINQLHTRPRLDVSLDGALLASVTVDEAGAFTIDLEVPKARLDGWSDLYIVFNAIGSPEREVRDLRLARLEELTWEPR